MLEIFAVPFYSEVLPTTLGQQIIQRKFELEKKNQGVASFQDFFFVALPVFSSQIAPDAILILVDLQIKPSLWNIIFYESQLKTKIGKCSFQMACYANYF